MTDKEAKELEMVKPTRRTRSPVGEDCLFCLATGDASPRLDKPSRLSSSSKPEV